MTKQVLILDDNNDNRSLLSYCFLALTQGYQIHQAAIGGEVPPLMEKTRFDLAFLDIELPDADVLELAHQLRERFPDIVIVMLSANDEVDKLERARKIGANAYIVKPFNLPEILKFIREAEKPTQEAGKEMQVM